MENEQRDTFVSNFNQYGKSAFEPIFNLLHERLFVFAVSIIKNQEEAQDIVQESFIKLISTPRTFPAYPVIESFMIASVRNKCIDYLRKQNPLKNAVALSDDYDPIDYQNDLLDLDLTEELYKAISAMPERNREVIVLFYLKSLKVKEIATLLNTSVKSIERLLARSRQLIFKSYGG